MQFSISITYETWDDSAYTAGDTDDKGYEIQDQKIGYQDLVRLIEVEGFTHPSSYPRVDGYTWLSADGILHNDGTIEYRSLHINSRSGYKLSRRKMNKLFRSAGIRT